MKNLPGDELDVMLRHLNESKRNWIRAKETYTLSGRELDSYFLEGAEDKYRHSLTRLADYLRNLEAAI